METITWEDFEKIELRTGEIVEVNDFPEARKPAYKLKVNFGNEIGIKQSSVQIVDLYTKEQLLGKHIIGVVNFPSKQIGPFISECLVTGFANDKGEIVLAVPDTIVSNGQKLL